MGRVKDFLTDDFGRIDWRRVAELQASQRRNDQQHKEDEQAAEQATTEERRDLIEGYKEEERREMAHRRWMDQRRLDALREEARRDEDEHQRWMKDHPLDQDAARRLAEREEADEQRLEALRRHPDPEVREIGEKIWQERDSQQAAAEEEWEADGGDAANEREAERQARSAQIREAAEPDPGWLARWEREGTLSPLTHAEREKLREIDRQDPFGREQRAMFLPREVLAIRAKSDRMVEERQMAAREAPAKDQAPPWHRIAEAAPDLQDWAADMDHLKEWQMEVEKNGGDMQSAVALEDEFTQDNHQMVASWRAGQGGEIDIDHEVARVRQGLAEQQKHEAEHKQEPQQGQKHQAPELEQDDEWELE